MIKWLYELSCVLKLPELKSTLESYEKFSDLMIWTIFSMFYISFQYGGLMTMIYSQVFNRFKFSEQEAS